jgi:hypothetical protein
MKSKMKLSEALNLKRRAIAIGGMLLAALAFIGVPADAAGPSSGSILIFPYYDSHPNSFQVITITNTNSDTSQEPGSGLFSGTIDVMFMYIDGTDCLPSDRVERLTPNDTFSFIPAEHNFSQDQIGFLYVYAIDPETGSPAAFDYLIGTETVFDSTKQAIFSLNPITIRSGAEGPDEDHMLALNGLEYEKVADEILIPRFYGQGDGHLFSSPFKSSLILMNLTGGAFFHAQAKLLIMNDNEQAFSAMVEFDCWDWKQLYDVSGATHLDFLEGTNNDPEEVAMGLLIMEVGWIRIQGDLAYNPSGGTGFPNPAIFAFQLEESVANGYISATLPFEKGAQDNGLLWSTSAGGY